MLRNSGMEAALWPETGLCAAWLGHSTVLLKIDGVTVLTDPVFSDAVGVRFGSAVLGPARLTRPAADPAKLPKIDLVVLSHAHYDHLDTPSLRMLESSGTTVVTASRTSDLLRRQQWGRVQELGWGEEIRERGLTVRAIEVNHWGARWQVDIYRGFNGYVLSTPRHRVLFAGDTAFTGAFAGLRSLGRIQLAIMPIGAYKPWVWFHCTPEQAWKMADDARADCFMPVHHQTFRLSRESTTEPLERLYAASGSSARRVVGERLGACFALD